MWPTRLGRSAAVCLAVSLGIAAGSCGPGNQATRRAAPCDERFSVVEATIGELQAAIRSGRTTCHAVVASYLERIARYDQPTGLNAITAIDPTALAAADAVDAAIARGVALPPLFCAPIVVKDNFDTAGLATTAGSITLADNVATTDAFVVARLEAAGAIVIAKTNMAEWGLLADTTVSSTHGETANAYALDRVAAGSSGGTASAVAASFGVAGLGTDTGESIRGPSSHLNLVGLRPTLGLTSRTGVIPVLRDRDIAGPMARTTEDAARILQAMTGYDPADPMTALIRDHPERDYTRFLDRRALVGARIGVLRATLDGPDVDSEIVRLFEAALRDLAAQGATLVDPFVIDGLDDYRQAALVCERFRFDLHAYMVGLGAAAPFTDIAALLATGQFVPANAAPLLRLSTEPIDVPPEHWPVPCPSYPDHLARRAFLGVVVDAMDRARVDAVVYPTWTKMPPHRIKTEVAEGGGDPGEFIAPATGQPAITVPMGFSMDELPVGLELLGRPFAEGQLIALAYGYEQATHHRRPPPAFEPRFVPGCLGDRTVAPSVGGE